MKKIFAFFLISILSLLLIIAPGHSQNQPEIHNSNPVILTDQQKEYPLGLHLEIFEDRTKQLTIEDVVKQKFTPSQKTIPNLGMTKSAIWVKFKVKNEASLNQKWHLIFADSKIGKIELYLPQENNQGFLVKKTGRYLPFQTREYNHRFLIFDLPNYQQETTIYLRLTSKSIIFIPLIITSLDQFLLQDTIEVFIRAFITGSVLIISIYNLFLYFSLKDKSYLYYVFFNLSYLFYDFWSSGFLYQYLYFLIPNFFIVNAFQLQLFFGILMNIAQLKFTDNFLELKKYTLKLHQIVTFFLISDLGFIGSLYWFKEANSNLHDYLTLNILLANTTILIIGIIRFTQKYLPSRYFMLGTFMPIIGLILFCLRLLRLINTNIHLANLIPDIGMILSVVLFSFALADKINLFKQQKDKAQKEALINAQLNEKLIKDQNIILEQKVIEKTQEITNTLAKLSESERTLSTLMANLPGMAYRSYNEQEWGLTFVSEGCFNLTGYQPQDFKSGKIKFGEIIDPEYQEYVWQEVQKAIKNYQSFQLIYRIITANNEVKWVWEQGIGIYNNDRELLFLEGFIADINERKEMEIALEEAKQKAEVANQAKSRFIANMSHELRTPLNAILGFSQILGRSPNLNPEEKQNINIINRSGDYLLTLINNILDLAKIEAGKHELNLNNFDLDRLLHEVEDLFIVKAETKGLNLIFEREENLPRYITTDETKLKQVLINLLNNAIKFTTDGFIKVTICRGECRGKRPFVTTKEIENYQQLIFTIEDTGLGISEAEIGKLFEAFNQTETGKNSQEGTGLGLAISRQFVKLMGGNIEVKSQLGSGTIFSFNIQVNVIRTNQIKPQKIKRHVIGVAPNQPVYKILIVDDKEDNRWLLIKLLKPLNFELKEASNGKEAIEIWENWQPHLIWMDMRMPVMNGYEATQYIKGTTKGNATAIIAITASVLEEEKAVILSAGCDDFVRKPFQESIIFETMAKHLGIEYLYEEEKETPVIIKTKPLTLEDLQVMSSEWLTRFHQAALDLDEELIIELIKEIPTEYDRLAQSLRDLVNQCQIDYIFNLLESQS